MSNAYLNLIGGLSGDMLLSSLIDAGLDPKKLSKELNKISEIDFEISVNKTERQNLKATHIDVVVNDSIKWTWPKLYKAVESSKLNEEIGLSPHIIELKYEPNDDLAASIISNNLPWRMTRSSKYVDGVKLINLFI